MTPARSHRFPPLAALLAMLASGACAGTQDTDHEPTPAEVAKAAYEEAEESFEAGNYLEAIKEFQVVRTRHPYSVHAPLAELRVGDCHFEMGKFAEATEAYRSFSRFHPHHDRVPYALFRVGEAYFEDMPEDWFFMPPAYEKDAASTRDAERALREFLTRFAKTDKDHAPRAKEMLDFTRRRLADHEMYVARFYMDRDKPVAAAGRLEALVRDFPDTGLAGEARLLLAELNREQD